MKNQIGKKVIVRADKAGVFFGTLTKKEGSEVQLTKVRKIYYWEGANAIEQIAADGLRNPENCKITVENEEATVNNYIQIITCTDSSIKNIENIPAWAE